MRVFITGISSIIGVQLSSRLIADGHTVVGFDLTKSRDLARSVQFVEGDICDIPTVIQASSQCDAGIHLAVLAGESSEKEILTVNVLGAYAFFRASSTNNFKMAVLAGSAPVHLAPNQTDRSILAQSSADADHVYDLSKTLQEVIANDYHSHGLSAICLRIGHVVRGQEQTTLDSQTPLSELDYCRGGWVAIEDLVEACTKVLEYDPKSEFRILSFIGSRMARQRFMDLDLENELDMVIRYEFAEYENIK
jgi:nucleoside-diphosphate-sugar epimerase